jgi:hypothetical protein
VTRSDAALRLAVAQSRLETATALGIRRDVAAWQIAVEVLRDLAEGERAA